MSPPSPPRRTAATPHRPGALPVAVGVAVSVALIVTVGLLWSDGGTPTPDTTPTTAAPSSTSPETLPGRGPIVFAEEFDGDTLDTRRWTPYFNTYGDGNKELACLTPRNVEVAGGSLRITARKETATCPGGVERRYTSGFISTRETGGYLPRYGRFEIRARLPHGQGLWPAFWLRHRDGARVGEVDVMEYFHVQHPGMSTGTLHWNVRRNVAQESVFFETPTATPGWHVWAVEIDPVDAGVRFRWSLDDHVYLTHVEADRSPLDGDPTQPLWDLAVNLAVGGNWAGDPDGRLGCLDAVDRCFDRSQVRPAQFPATYEVDWVRVSETTTG